jgi:hypothetical protein
LAPGAGLLDPVFAQLQARGSPRGAPGKVDGVRARGARGAERLGRGGGRHGREATVSAAAKISRGGRRVAVRFLGKAAPFDKLPGSTRLALSGLVSARARSALT